MSKHPTKAKAKKPAKKIAKPITASAAKSRIAAAAAANTTLAPPAEGSLLALLKAKVGDKSAVMNEIHVRLAEMRVFIDQAILEAEGDLKAVLVALRVFLF